MQTIICLDNAFNVLYMDESKGVYTSKKYLE